MNGLAPGLQPRDSARGDRPFRPEPAGGPGEPPRHSAAAESARRDRRVACLLLGVALAARLVVFLLLAGDEEGFLYNDSASYLRTAASLLHGAYSLSGAPPYEPTALRTPVYPAFLAAGQWIAGDRLWAVVLLQVVLASLLAPLTYRLARRWLPPGSALLAGLIPALDPLTVIYSSAVMTEALATLLLMLAVLATLRAVDTARLSLAGGAGLLCAALVLCRPAALPVPFLVAPLFLAAPALSWRRRSLGAALFLAAFGAGTAPWLIRNAAVMGAPVLSTVTGEHVLQYQAAELVAHTQRIPIETARARLRAEVSSWDGETRRHGDAETRGRGEGETGRRGDTETRRQAAGPARESQVTLSARPSDSSSPRLPVSASPRLPLPPSPPPGTSPELARHVACMRRAKEIIAAQPLLFAALKVRDLARLAVVPGLQGFRRVFDPAGYAREERPAWRELVRFREAGSPARNALVLLLAGAQVGLLLLLYAGAALALWRLRRTQRWESASTRAGWPGLVALVALAASFYVMASHFHGDPRLRLPAVPFLAVAGVFGWCALRRRPQVGLLGKSVIIRVLN